MVSGADAETTRKVARMLGDEVLAWLKEHHATRLRTT
jgi:hypothetical protein